MDGVGPTSVTEVINQHDLSDQLWGRAVQHAVDGAEEGGPALIVEGDDDASVGERLQVALAVAARGRHRGQEEVRFSFLLPRRTQRAHGLANRKSYSFPAFRERVRARGTSVTSEPPSTRHPKVWPPIPAHTVHRDMYTRVP